MQWYEGDVKRIQLSCRHRQKSESKEELKIWNISFSDSDDEN